MSTVAIPVQTEDARTIRVGWASSTSLFPIQIVMVGQIARGWELIKPVDLSVDRETDGSYIASDELFNISGEGFTASECVFDYLASLIEYYRLVSRHEDEPTQALRIDLEQYLRAT